MIINIDYRETKLIELIKPKIDAHNDNAKNAKNIITLEISNLPLGDIITSFPLEIPSALHHGDLYYINEKECYRDDFDLFSD